ncbi:hypothetical protein LVJ94_52255 [Pendulispora rubella]|uniref:Uncharacterized protein n=1 Tax=Pendulispora rubella TaxID=2741070 RepID=A0ABZ2L684_9BACT
MALERIDVDLWNELIASHDRSVFLALLAMGLAPDRARDLAQRTWLTLMERHREGKLASLELPGLAIRQAQFLARDEGRQQVRQRTLLRDWPGPEGYEDEPRVLAREDVRTVERALRGCAPAARRIFLAVYEESATPHAEMARRLGISLQHLRQTLCDVRRVLRAALEDGHD